MHPTVVDEELVVVVVEEEEVEVEEEEEKQEEEDEIQFLAKTFSISRPSKILKPNRKMLIFSSN